MTSRTHVRSRLSNPCALVWVDGQAVSLGFRRLYLAVTPTRCLSMNGATVARTFLARYYDPRPRRLSPNCRSSTRFVIIRVGSALHDVRTPASPQCHSCLGNCPVANLRSTRSFVLTWKVVNNLGVALLSQGKLKEVCLRSLLKY